jgi:hypothetical protein
MFSISSVRYPERKLSGSHASCPTTGAGFQYRIKGEQDGFERVVIEFSLEAID